MVIQITIQMEIRITTLMEIQKHSDSKTVIQMAIQMEIQIMTLMETQKHSD